MQAECNECKEMTNIKFVEAQRPLGVKETYFRCENCNEHYTCFVTNKKIRSMQKAVGRRRENGENVLDDQEEIGEMMKELKRTFETDNKRKGGE